MGDSSTDNVYTSTGFLGFIERHEGFSATGYRGIDSQNVTIGYGHVDYTGEYENRTLTPADADALLRSDLTEYEKSVAREFAGTYLTDFQFDALTSYAYNLGPNIWPKAKRLVGDIKGGASPEVLKQDFTVWDCCNGKSYSGLYNRRCDEWKLFCYGDYGGTS